MSEAWLPPETPPEFGAIVWLCWPDGKVRRGARILHKRKRCAVWGWIEGKRGRVRIHRTPPAAWRPLGRLRLAEPDPEPPTFLPSASKPVATRSEVESRAWWRDPCNLTYSPAGSINPHEAEGRVLRALLTARATKLENPRGPGSNSDWIAKMILKYELETGLRDRASFFHDRFQPTHRDVSDYDVAMRWLFNPDVDHQDLRPREYDVLNLRSADPPFSWAQIAAMKGWKCSRTVVARTYKMALLRVTANANGVRHAPAG